MKFDQRTSQGLIKSAMRQRHPPGKYDVFAWKADRELQSIAVAWKSFTRRSVNLENITLDDGQEIETNAARLPNGIDRNAARYLGSFRIDKRSDSED